MYKHQLFYIILFVIVFAFFLLFILSLDFFVLPNITIEETTEYKCRQLGGIPIYEAYGVVNCAKEGYIDMNFPLENKYRIK